MPRLPSPASPGTWRTTRSTISTTWGGTAQPEPLATTVRIDGPLDLRLTLGPICRGPRDPCNRFAGATFWRATRTPDGPAALAVEGDPANAAVRGWAWGPGAGWLLAALPALVGGRDDVAGFSELVAALAGPGAPPGWSTVAAWARHLPGLRIPATQAVVEACVPTVLEQKVKGVEARRSYRQLLAALGEPAPGPAGERGMRLPLSPGQLAGAPSWSLHRYGIERRRAEILARVGAAAHHLEGLTRRPPADARTVFRAIPGLGPWSAAEVALVALGDADAVSVGDYHLPHQLAWAFLGRSRGDDDLMLELLEPWRGHRGRILRMVDAAGVAAPRFGPRQPVRSWRDW